MFIFSQKSINNLRTCHYNLVDIAMRVILESPIDFTVICGFRDEKSQLIAYQENRSKLKWPDSKHNKWPSEAFDLAPYPIEWENINRFYMLAGAILTVSNSLNINLKWGGGWGDYGHFELQ